MASTSLLCPFCRTPANWGCQGLHGYGTCPECRASGDVRREGLFDTPHWAPGFPKQRAVKPPQVVA